MRDRESCLSSSRETNRAKASSGWSGWKGARRSPGLVCQVDIHPPIVSPPRLVGAGCIHLATRRGAEALALHSEVVQVAADGVGARLPKRHVVLRLSAR